MRHECRNYRMVHTTKRAKPNHNNLLVVPLQWYFAHWDWNDFAPRHPRISPILKKVYPATIRDIELDLHTKQAHLTTQRVTVLIK